MSLLGFALALIACLAGLVLGRWAAGFLGSGPLKRRRLRDAVTWNDGPLVAFARVFGGAFGYYLGASLVLIIAALAVGKPHVDETSMRVNVSPDGPAGRAGIQKGDRIVSVDGVPIRNWDELKAEIAKHEGLSTRVEVERGGASLTIEVTPEANEHGPAKIMVGPFSDTQSVPVGKAIADGLSDPAKIFINGFRAWGELFGSRKERVEATGPVGIVREAHRAGAFVSGLRLGAAIAAYFQHWIFLGMIAAAVASRPWRKGSTTRP